MILQRLIEYYDRRFAAVDDPVPGFGLGRERIAFELVIDPSTGTADLNDLRTVAVAADKNGRPKLQSRWMTVPYRGDRSRNVKPNFLWDNTGYVFGRTSRAGANEKKRKSFLELHQELLAQVPDAGLKAMVDFLSRWTPEKYDQFQLAPDALDQNIVFRIKAIPSFVHELSTLQCAWANFFRKDIEQRLGTSLIDGQTAAIAATHFLIPGVSGAQPTGAALSSFNGTAYTSYGLKGSFNSPVSIDQVFKYGSALKELLDYDRRKITLGDATLVFWAENCTPLEDYAGDIFADAAPPKADAPIEHKQRAEQVRLLVSQLREGQAVSDATNSEGMTRFYVLGLSPNAARISVRLWIESTVGEVKDHLAQHLRDIELTGARENDAPLVIRRLVGAAGRAELDSRGKFKRYDADAVSPLLAGAVARAVLTGSPYPRALLTAMICRLRSDGVVGHARIAAVKGCLVRNSRARGTAMQVPLSLDTEIGNPPYLAGRLFAVLEKLQKDSAGGSLDRTIRDRYFAAACAVPATVFPMILRLGQRHLQKLSDARQRAWSALSIRRITAKLDRFPETLDLEGQGMFAIGFYQQNRELYRKRTASGERQ